MKCRNMHRRPTNGHRVAQTWPVRWHRVRAIREREEISLNAFARRTKMAAGTLRKLEQEDSDLPLSVLHRMAEGLGVPVSELLIDPQEGLSEPIRQRACLVRIARTAQTLLEQSKSQAMRSLSQTLVNELTELMPELAGIGTWPEFGTRRPISDLPRILERMVCGASASINDSTSDWWDNLTKP